MKKYYLGCFCSTVSFEEVGISVVPYVDGTVGWRVE